MFSVLFPGQGSQFVGMAKEFFNNFKYIKDLFEEADNELNFKLSDLILNGPKDLLDQTENTQPAIFLASYSIFKCLEKETSFTNKSFKFYAGHSLGEYSAIACSGALNFIETLKLLKLRGQLMQHAVKDSGGGMIAILGSEIDIIKQILNNNEDNFKCYIANDNSNGQVVISGYLSDLNNLSNVLKKKNIKNMILPVSAPFHCPLMNDASEKMQEQILKTDFDKPVVPLISNVTAKPVESIDEIKKLLIQQINSPVRWRESMLHIINNGVTKFIEIGPGKVLSGLVKRIDNSVILKQINDLNDIKKINE